MSQPQFPVPQPRLQKAATSDADDEERVEVGQPQMAQTFSVGTIKSGDF